VCAPTPNTTTTTAAAAAAAAPTLALTRCAALVLALVVHWPTSSALVLTVEA
jgi:hypothetical protein